MNDRWMILFYLLNWFLSGLSHGQENCGFSFQLPSGWIWILWNCQVFRLWHLACSFIINNAAVRPREEYKQYSFEHARGLRDQKVFLKKILGKKPIFFPFSSRHFWRQLTEFHVSGLRNEGPNPLNVEIEFLTKWRFKIISLPTFSARFFCLINSCVFLKP